MERVETQPRNPRREIHRKIDESFLRLVYNGMFKLMMRNPLQDIQPKVEVEEDCLVWEKRSPSGIVGIRVSSGYFINREIKI